MVTSPNSAHSTRRTHAYRQSRDARGGTNVVNVGGDLVTRPHAHLRRGVRPVRPASMTVVKPGDAGGAGDLIGQSSPQDIHHQQ
jgi:hypothetical protein